MTSRPTPEPSPTRDAVSAGGIVYRHAPEGVEVVLVYRHSERLWALPKGTPNAGETIEETALREVREETGLVTRIVEPVGEVRYAYTDREGARVQKVVYHYLMEPVGGDTADHDHEFDRVEWCHISEAERLLTHRNQLHLLQAAADRIARISS